MQKLDDGIYELSYQSGGGDIVLLGYIVNGFWREKRDGRGYAIPDGNLRRIADLDGKPVVPEGVIEAIVIDLLAYVSLTQDKATTILKSHLCTAKQDAVEASQHVLFKTGDQDAPDSILDRNGDVAIGLCRICNRAEVELDEPCIPPPERPTVELREIEACGADAKKWAQLFMRLNGQRLAQIDESDMLGWFANAIEFAYTARMNKQVEELPDQSAPTAHHFRETATSDEWIFLPEDNRRYRWGLRLRDKRVGQFMDVAQFERSFTPLPPAEADAPIVPVTSRENRKVARRLRGIMGRIGVATDTARVRDEIVTLVNMLELQPAALGDDAPIVKFEGAFVCWRKEDQAEHTAWPDQGVYRFVRHDGTDTGFLRRGIFDDYFTRTKPATITLPPEQERLVGPLADWAKRKPEEAREVLSGALSK